MKHQPPDYDYKVGHSFIVPHIYLAGEDDVDELLYGLEEARSLNNTGAFTNAPDTSIDVWIDLRDIRDSNRQIHIPKGVEYISIPFRDGVYEEAVQWLPEAKRVFEQKREEGKRILVSCHQGRSRSALLVIWQLSEEMGYFDAYWKVKGKRPIVAVDKKFKPFLEEWQEKYRTVEK